MATNTFSLSTGWGPSGADSEVQSLQKINGILAGTAGVSIPVDTAGGSAFTNSSSSTISTSNGDVATLGIGEVLSIQNLDTSPLKLRLGTGADATHFNIVLPACTSAQDGTSPPVFIDFWRGVVSVYSAGTPSYQATKLS